MEDVLHLPKSTANLVKLDLRYVTTMIQKVNSIEEELKEESMSKKFQLNRVEDIEGS